MTPIYHLTTADAWDRALALGEYRPPSLAAEGFIHASTLGQLAGSAGRFFEGHASLLVLEIDPARLDVPLIWEPSSHAPDPFPHLYGPLAVGAVASIRRWSRDLDGRFDPADLGP